MLGRLGLKIFLTGLFATIVLYHFVAKVWMLSWVPMTCLGVMGVGFLLWFVFSIEWIISWVQKRSSQFGMSVIVSALGVLGILCVLNWVAVQKNWKKDLTKNNFHSLSEQSIKVLKSLKEDITLEVWTFNMKDMSGLHDMSHFLDNYVQSANGHVKLSVKNPNTDRLDAIQSKITRKDVIIAKAASGRESRIDNFNDARAEEQITNAIIQAVKGRKKILCFLAGHGELESTQMGENKQSISELKQSLEGSSYSVRDITLATEKVVPTECEMIASVGPKSAPSEGEIALLKGYLAQGGKLLALWGFETPLAWTQALAPYGVNLDNNILIDERVQGAPAVYTKNFSLENELTKNFNQPLLFVLARSISIPAAPPAGVSVKALVTVESGTLMKEGDLKTLKSGVVARKSLAQANAKAVVVEIKQNVAEEKKEEKKDAAALAKGSTETPPPAKETDIILVGNHMVASNGLISQFGNMDFLLNTISYLMKDTDLMGIHPKDVKSAKLELTGERLREVQGYLLLSTLAFLVFAFMAGVGRKTTLANT